jgi:hypothetical protein
LVKVKEDMTGWKMWEHGVKDSELIVIERDEDYIIPSNGQRAARWRCLCSCGNSNCIVQQSHLRSGHTKTCGHDLHKTNKYNLSGEYGIGWTTNTNQEFYFDLEDYDKIKHYNWYEHNPVYNYKTLLAYDKQTNTKIKFWWVVFGKGCDHINRNTFDNRKNNLRECTQQENRCNNSLRQNNTSSIIGVSLHKISEKWVAYLNKDKKRVYTSHLCNTKEEAIKLRLQAELKYFGEFAPQIHLFEQYGIEVNRNEC